jgi:nitrogen fixation protein NifU and related proteins
MNLDTLYQEIILDHYRHPHHKGLRDPFDAEVHHVNPTCGDEVTLRVKVAHGQGQPMIEDVSYDSLGCSISQASASVMTDLVVGRSLGDATKAYDEFLALMQSRGEGEPDEEVLEDAVAFAGVSKYPARIKCALLGWMAWKDATARALSGLEAATDTSTSDTSSSATPTSATPTSATPTSATPTTEPAPSTRRGDNA